MLAIRGKWAAVAVVGLLLGIFCALSLGAALQKSPTADESFHLVAGYSYIRWGDFRINPEHPPLVKVLAALPLLTLGTDDSALSRERRDQVQVNGKYGWLLANQWLFSTNDAETLFFYARLPMVAFAVALGLLVFCWARELYGLAAAIAALTLYVLDPNILAHSSIIHTDIPFALAFFGGSYFFWRLLRAMTWFNWLGTVAFFSLSAVTKFSFVTILPIWGLLALSVIFSSQPLRLPSGLLIADCARKAGWVAAIFLSLTATAFLAVWGAYGFRYEFFGGERGPLVISSAVEPSAWFKFFIATNAERHFLPEAWLAGLVYSLSTFNRTAYLLGQLSGDGFWLYFPIAFAVKTPLPTLALLLCSLIASLWRPRKCADERFLFVPLLLFFGLAMCSGMNIGLRHILVIYPFLFVWLGGSAVRLWTSRSAALSTGTIVMAVWLAGSTLAAFPNYLAYFNEAVDSRRAHEILVDSNLDWGQDLKGLKKWMDANGVKRIRLAYFGTADPAYYGINAVYMPGTWTTVMSKTNNGDNAPADPYIAISATHLVGVYFASNNPYAKFLRETPVATIGGSIFVYRMDPF